MTLLQALRQTRAKWEDIIVNRPDWWISDIGCGFCEYSKEENKKKWIGFCHYCPICEMTGHACWGTPFILSSNLENALLEYDFIHHVAYATGILKP